MKWTDLRPGDILEFNPEFLTAFNNTFERNPRFWHKDGRYINVYDNGMMTVTDINIIQEADKLIRVAFSGWRIRITCDGKLHKFVDGPPVFILVSVSEDH